MCAGPHPLGVLPAVDSKEPTSRRLQYGNRQGFGWSSLAPCLHNLWENPAFRCPPLAARPAAVASPRCVDSESHCRETYTCSVAGMETVGNLIATLRHRDTWKQLPHVDALLFGHDVNRAESLGGKAYSRLEESTAALLAERGITFAKVANQYSLLVGRRAWGHPHSVNRMAARNALTRVVASPDAATAKWFAMYQRLLEQCRPKVIVTLSTPHELARAARRAGIPVVEIDHARGRGAPSAIELALDPECMPNVLVVFDETTYKGLKPLELKGMELQLCRDPWLARFQRPQGTLPEEWRFPLASRPTHPRRVLVTLQWGWPAQSLLVKGFLPKPIAELINRRLDDTYWFLRLHPVHLRKLGYRHVRSHLRSITRRFPNVDWKVSSSIPLPSMLQESTHHVTWASNSSVEAAQLGIPSALLDPEFGPGQRFEHYYRTLRETGWVTHLDAGNPDALATWLSATPDLTLPGDPALTGVDDVVAQQVEMHDRGVL